MRNILMNVGDAWVNTDDLNDYETHQDNHFTTEGYQIFGRRLAEAAIGLACDSTIEACYAYQHTHLPKNNCWDCYGRSF